MMSSPPVLLRYATLSTLLISSPITFYAKPPYKKATPPLSADRTHAGLTRTPSPLASKRAPRASTPESLASSASLPTAASSLEIDRAAQQAQFEYTLNATQATLLDNPALIGSTLASNHKELEKLHENLRGNTWEVFSPYEYGVAHQLIPASIHELLARSAPHAAREKDSFAYLSAARTAITEHHKTLLGVLKGPYAYSKFEDGDTCDICFLKHITEKTEWWASTGSRSPGFVSLIISYEIFIQAYKTAWIQSAFSEEIRTELLSVHAAYLETIQQCAHSLSIESKMPLDDALAFKEEVRMNLRGFVRDGCS